MRVLRELGCTKRSMETHISREYQELAQQLTSSGGKDVNVDGLFMLPAFNVIWRLIAGRRYACRTCRLLIVVRGCNIIRHDKLFYQATLQFCGKDILLERRIRDVFISHFIQSYFQQTYPV
ncbi:Farnesoate epoxidase [Amphibalanus amphitrite]|uniref:Farnesoate epoxidase n=1 Tax=Amphibalanus amphitrite TaxID=1232801 RepID=A0A6A4VKS5_AMPAM|nr:Farnesoate epoxidase [Amphibalanus amphitrite]